MNLEIKNIGIESIDLIVKWKMELIKNNAFNFPKDYIETEDYDVLHKNIRNYYNKKLGSDEHIECFAYWKGNLAGGGGVCIYETVPSLNNENGKCGYIMNIYIKPEYRLRGIATAIVDHLINESKSLGVKKIYLKSTEMGKSVYEKIGFSEMKDYMKLNLSNQKLCK